jgi:quinoprotein glucose dehydrogenase
MAWRRGAESARRAFLKVADEILNPMTPDERGVVVPGGAAPVAVQLALVDAAAGLRTKEAAQPLMEHYESTNATREVRAAIVGFLAGLRAVQAPAAIQQALSGGDGLLRAAALPHLGMLEPGDALPLLPRLLAPTNPVAVRQAAVGALARLGSSEADALLLPWVVQLGSGDVPPELSLDVLLAARVRREAHPEIERQLGRWLASLPGAKARERLVLHGGDAGRGGAIFKNHPQVQCLRCHKVGGDGGIVGPALDGIGRQRDRAYLLQSILSPNAAYAEGYRPAEGGLSAMPEGLGDLLSDAELRDVIEFLASLK